MRPASAAIFLSMLAAVCPAETAMLISERHTRDERNEYPELSDTTSGFIMRAMG